MHWPQHSCYHSGNVEINVPNIWFALKGQIYALSLHNCIIASFLVMVKICVRLFGCSILEFLFHYLPVVCLSINLIGVNKFFLFVSNMHPLVTISSRMKCARSMLNMICRHKYKTWINQSRMYEHYTHRHRQMIFKWYYRWTGNT
jgi:hypothetical protein